MSFPIELSPRDSTSDKQQTPASPHVLCLPEGSNTKVSLSECCDTHPLLRMLQRAWPQAGLPPLGGWQAAGRAQLQVTGHHHHGYLHIPPASHTTLLWSCCLEEQELITCWPGHCREWWREDALGRKPPNPIPASTGMQLDQRNQRALGPDHTTNTGGNVSAACEEIVARQKKNCLN